jgi:hypothetical protein
MRGEQRDLVHQAKHEAWTIPACAGSRLLDLGFYLGQEAFLTTLMKSDITHIHASLFLKRPGASQAEGQAQRLALEALDEPIEPSSFDAGDERTKVCPTGCGDHPRVIALTQRDATVKHSELDALRSIPFRE